MTEKKILVVDYDAKSLDSLTKLLRANKFRVVTAADGRAGYDAFVAEKPDLVVLEAMLPKMHGFDLTRKIAQESQGRVPIILVTGLYKGPKYRQEALGALGASEYLEKPIDTEALLAAIRRLSRDEDEIDEELPDSNAVIESLSRRGRAHGAPREDARPAAKGQRP